QRPGTGPQPPGRMRGLPVRGRDAAPHQAAAVRPGRPGARPRLPRPAALPARRRLPGRPPEQRGIRDDPSAGLGPPPRRRARPPGGAAHHPAPRPVPAPSGMGTGPLRGGRRLDRGGHPGDGLRRRRRTRGAARGHPGADRLRDRARGRVRANPAGPPRHGSGGSTAVPAGRDGPGRAAGQQRSGAAGHLQSPVSGGRDGAGPRRSATASAAVLCLLLCLVAVTAVADSPGFRPAERRGGDGMEILRRAAENSVRLHYQGVRSVSWVDSAGRTGTARLDVLHRPGVGLLVSPLHATAGSADVLVGAGSWEGTGEDVLAVLEANFWVRADGAATVGGRPALRVVVHRDSGQVAARFWVDERTGLLLRREVYDITGEVAQTSVFESVRFGADAVAETGGTARPDVVSRPWGDRLDPHELALLRDGGWPLPERLFWGFVLVEARS